MVSSLEDLGRVQRRAPCLCREETLLYKYITFHRVPHLFSKPRCIPPRFFPRVLLCRLVSNDSMCSRYGSKTNAQSRYSYPLLFAIPIRPVRPNVSDRPGFPTRLGISYSLEKIRTHGPLASIALQAPYALVRSFLTRVKVLAIRFATSSISAMYPRCAFDVEGGLVESGGSRAAPFFGLVVGLGGWFVAHCELGYKRRVCVCDACTVNCAPTS